MTSKIEISISSRLTLASNVSLQSLGEEEGGVLLRLDSGEMYTINDTAVAFLKELDGFRSIADVATRLMNEFDVEHDTLMNDLVDVAQELASHSLVVILE